MANTTVADLAVEIALQEAAARVFERENANRGDRIDEYQQSTSGKLGEAWCLEFVYWCFEQAAWRLNTGNPMPAFFGAPQFEGWARTSKKLVTAPARGDMFVKESRHGGLVTGPAIRGGTFPSVEGNTWARSDFAHRREGLYVLQNESHSMHLRALGVIGYLTAAMLLLSVACNAATPAPPSARADLTPKPAPHGSVIEGPCGNRPNCAVDGSQSIEGLPRARLTRVVVAAPGAGQKDGECERREYWLTDSARKTLLAADCAAQYGADSQGPAEVKLVGSSLSVSYVEFQEDDRCELVDATINLVAVTIERQDRRVGAVARDQCIPEKPDDVVPATGDGSINNPLLVLHRG